MQREIKFRTWYKPESKFYFGKDACAFPEFTYSWRDGNRNNYIIQQYTGLKDENGVEIYEGDILCMPITTFDTEDIVDFIQEAVIFEGASFKWHGDFLEENLTKDLSIVCNIFENGVVY